MRCCRVSYGLDSPQKSADCIFFVRTTWWRWSEWGNGWEQQQRMCIIDCSDIHTYNEHIEFYLNTLPADILRGEIDRSLGIGEDETLVEHMMRYDPQIMDVLRKLVNKKDNGAVTDSDGSSDFYIKKADKSTKNAELSTFCGGGERWRKKVDNLADLLTNLPRTEVVVPNTTYKGLVIGRRVLNYCGGFGVEG